MSIKLWDRLLRLPPTNVELIERARRDLKLPSTNHLICEQSCQPMAERFLFADTALDDLMRVFDDEESRWSAVIVARVPCIPCWVETGDYAWHFWSDDRGRTMCTFFMDGRTPLAVFHFDGLRDESDETPVTLTPAAVAIQLTGDVPDIWFSAAASRVVFLLAALSQPRVATVRRQIPGGADGAAERASRLRRAQIGRPVFSFNVVEFRPAQTALHRGVLKPVESFAGMRGHVVMGHWRLIDGKIEPYWIWVDGHRRGDDSLGTIVKERQVASLRGGLRRGFTVPAELGRHGERRAARRLS